MNKSVLFMAIAKGSDIQKIDRTNYTGIGVCEILAVNPTKVQIQEFMGYTPEEEPSYVNTIEDNGKTVQQARVSFVIRTIPEENNGISITRMLTFFLRNQYRQGSNTGKYQVMDNYGRTAWATKETIEAKETIMYSNGPANISKPYYPIYIGEEALTVFVRNFVNIPGTVKYVNGERKNKNDEELKACECKLEHIKDYFNGDFSEIKDVLSLRPNGKVKILFGIRTTESGERQDVYSEITCKYMDQNAHLKFEKEITDKKAAGALSNREYTFGELKSYTVTPTEIKEEESKPEVSPWG